MDVQRLRVLRELADRGSVTAVAAALSFTPSAISQQLKALAEEVGTALTEPAGRGLRLTDAGRVLAAEAEEVLAALARAEAAVEGLLTSPRGLVRVALFPSGARMMLAGVLARLDATPGVEVACRDVDMSPAAVVALTADFDVVVTHRDEHGPGPAPGRQVVPLLREPLDVVLPPGHRLARRRRLRLDELAGESWISVEVGWPVDDVLRSLAVRTGTAPRVVQRINDFSVTEELVAAGRGIALLPRYSTDDRGGRRLVRRPLAGVRAARLVEAVLRPSAAARPAVRTVLDALVAEAAAIASRAG
ncbi:LysR family transcriptional regulator [Pseudonocardia sp. KRD-184]|uniref:LysR family transcriptional regulator n=1 Tax=Pseudonocardia oceani TaxID=2792013 RepID=A0ABS6UH40_9PSEU|nr:LysR family transcriptional regulator [Pseudonocardia oceani]MBW0092036.1 LysR family transcriptional regulator [Pseudonocardia oceani]MBW0096244.1 LysR family transcriptional regulator [Pseudonocardia oceani]MBW0111594.1 LysR family transcriptional regulator [Pseudonocardia oceani]MBW0120123.1 LysR family transcriptional regulator [Pseudonocardia oceani]MBW0131543.1 LysR family transcriptional regulator [Pseudonocardia oceani]